MNFNDLIAAKSRPGSIQNFVRYKPVPGEVILEDAQALIYSQLRVREMRASALVTLGVGAFTAALPTGFLEPIVGQDREGWNVIPDRYVSEGDLMRRRIFDEDVVTTLSGAISSTTATSIGVASAAEFPSSGSFSIVIDSEVLLVTAGQGTTTWTVTRGYAGTTAATHASGATVDGMLESGTPTHVAVFDELFQFDCKADAARKIDLVYFKRPSLLSAAIGNQTNFLTTRYSNLLRVACMAEAARFMKDAEEFAAREAEVLALVQSANAESDLGKAA